jgi:hypothetical protein
MRWLLLIAAIAALLYFGRDLLGFVLNTSATGV